MFANLTEETCTGTNGTLTLLGETEGMLPYSASFADGKLAAYVVKDANGTTKCAGVGVWNTGNTITSRKDVWQAVAGVVTSYPATNVTLSGGTHTVYCEVVGELLEGLTGASATDDLYTVSAHTHPASGASSLVVTPDRQYSAPFLLKYPKIVSTLRCGVKTLAAASTSSIGISRMIHGVSDTVYLASGTVTTTATNNQAAYTLGSAILLTPGWYFIHFISDGAPAIEFVANSAQGWSPIEGVRGTDRNTPGSYNYLDSASVDGTLVADPSTVTSSQYNQTYPNIWLG